MIKLVGNTIIYGNVMGTQRKYFEGREKIVEVVLFVYSKWCETLHLEPRDYSPREANRIEVSVVNHDSFAK